MLASIWINFLSNCVQSLSAQILHLLHNVFLKVDFDSAFLDQLLKVREREHVSIFVVAVVRTILLDCIVGQMHKVIVQVLCSHVVWPARSPQVTLLKEIHIHVLSQGNPNAYVKLPLVH